MAAILASVTVAQAQFDFGNGQTSAKPWEDKTFKLNPKARIKLDFRNSSADAVIAYFERESGITIVKDPALTGILPLTSARPVPLTDAFQILSTTLSLKGYSLLKEGNLLVIKGKNQQQAVPSNNNPFNNIPTDVGQQNDRTVLRVYPITFANASQLARVLNDVYQPNQNGGGFPFFGGGGPGRFGGGGGPGGGGFRGGGGGFGGGGFQNFGRGGQQPPNIRASSDDFSNSVIVNAPDRNQSEVGDLIKKLDIESELPQTSKVYHLQFATATDTASVVQNVLTSNVPRGRGGATTQQQSGPAAFINAFRGQTAGAGQVATDLRTNSIVVTATKENLKIVDDVIKNIDHDVPVMSTTFVFPLNNARSDTVSQILQAAFGTRQGVTTPNLNQLNQGKIGSTGGTSPTTTTGNRPTVGTSTPLGSIPGNTDQMAMLPDASQQREMIAQGVKDLPIQLQDPNAQSGDLLTSIGITQGFGPQIRPGGGGGGFGQGGGGGTSQQGQVNQGRGQNGEVINIRDLTGQVTVIPDINTNTLIAVTSPENAAILRKIIEQLDQIPKQVMIETTIVEATLDASSALGVEWKFAQATQTAQQDFGQKPVPTTAVPNPAPQAGFSYTVTGKELSLYMHALETDTKFQVLSRPRIFTTNNVSASINVSQSVPYVTSTIVDATTGAQSSTYAFLNVGIVLTVQPRITSNGYVTLDIDQTANDLQSFTSFNAPIVNQREANTTVSVKDGETIILGGIIRKQITSTVNKIPLLGDIPILGQLFRSTSKDVTRSELLVFMTPHVVLNPDDARKLKDSTVHEMTPETQKTLSDSTKKGNGSPSKTNGG